MEVHNTWSVWFSQQNTFRPALLIFHIITFWFLRSMKLKICSFTIFVTFLYKIGVGRNTSFHPFLLWEVFFSIISIRNVALQISLSQLYENEWFIMVFNLSKMSRSASDPKIYCKAYIITCKKNYFCQSLCFFFYRRLIMHRRQQKQNYVPGALTW
jgi:hypothetical protein